MEAFIVLLLIFIAVRLFECARFLQKIFKLMCVQAGSEKVLEAQMYGKNI